MFKCIKILKISGLCLMIAMPVMAMESNTQEVDMDLECELDHRYSEGIGDSSEQQTLTKSEKKSACDLNEIGNIIQDFITLIERNDVWAARQLANNCSKHSWPYKDSVLNFTFLLLPSLTFNLMITATELVRPYETSGDSDSFYFYGTKPKREKILENKIELLSDILAILLQQNSLDELTKMTEYFYVQEKTPLGQKALKAIGFLQHFFMMRDNLDQVKFVNHVASHLLLPEYRNAPGSLGLPTKATHEVPFLSLKEIEKLEKFEKEQKTKRIKELEKIEKVRNKRANDRLPDLHRLR